MFTYEFEVDHVGVVTHLNATATVPDRLHWPSIEYTPGQTVKAQINLRSPYFAFLRQDLRAAAGVLSLFGLDEISTDDAEEFWESESEAEKDSLNLLSIRRNTESTSPESWPCISFDLAARALLAADRASDFEAALNFFRKGRIDVKAHTYLDAVLDFLFMVETTFANGKFKSAQVEAEYRRSGELKQLIEQSLKERALLANVGGNNRIEQSFRDTYLNRSADEILAHLVQLRGELHHHTSRKSGIWHPTDHVRFGADAYFLQQLCLAIAFSIANPTLYAEEVVKSFEVQAHQHAKAGTLKIYSK